MDAKAEKEKEKAERKAALAAKREARARSERCVPIRTACRPPTAPPVACARSRFRQQRHCAPGSLKTSADSDACGNRRCDCAGKRAG